VGIGFVRPFTVLPVSGVCASVSSKPAPAFARRVAARFDARGFDFRAAFPFGIFALEVRRLVLRPALSVRLVPAPLRAALRPRAPPRLLDGVRLRPLLEPRRRPVEAVRRAGFLAM
jgi:hypothetical protein